MSTQAYYQRRPHEALNLISAAQEAARGWSTPRVRSMLALREAAASAAMGDRSAFSNAMTRARWEFAAGRDASDPHWSEWLTESELSVQEASCFMDLGEPEDLRRVEGLLRKTLDNEIGRFQRNRALYVAWLALALRRMNDVGEAATVGIQALESQAGVSSSRCVAHLRSLRDQLSPHAASPAVGDFLDRYRAQFAGRDR